jgi:hypothetical protein
MSTNSTIALEFADGTIGQVYCHWDGHVEYNGKILFENYSDPFKLRDLIDLGDISSLGADIGTKHDFDQGVAGECTFYGRDRGEEGIGASYYTSYQDYLGHLGDGEYNYILRRDGVWYVNTDHGFSKLEYALAELDD